MKTIVFGAGKSGRRIKKFLDDKKTSYRIICFLDNNKEIKQVDNIAVYSPNSITHLDYDLIIISMENNAMVEEATNDLLKYGVDTKKIKIFVRDSDFYHDVIVNYNEYSEQDPRVNWIKTFSRHIYENNISGSVAECGVNKGDFSYFINKFFPDRLLYLFDTFEGFDQRDLDIERQINDYNFIHGVYNNNSLFKKTNESIVIDKMLYKDKIILKKGYFPETTKGIFDSFCFVNLDMDLYNPMYEGLRYFYSKMVSGGVILLHDYYDSDLPGVKKAIYNFEKSSEIPILKFPIGDGCSIAVIKQ